MAKLYKDKELSDMASRLCGPSGTWSTDEDDGCFVLYLSPIRLRELARVEEELTEVRRRFAFELMTNEQKGQVMSVLSSTDPYVLAVRDYIAKHRATAPGG